jgi:hypothetical protein
MEMNKSKNFKYCGLRHLIKGKSSLIAIQWGRVTFCFDYSALLKNPASYFDNFSVVHVGDSLEEMPTEGNPP